MMRKVRDRIPTAPSLKSEDVHGYRKIIHMILESDDLSEVEDRHLEDHEREALEMFKEFEKRDARKAGGRLPVFG